MMVATLLPAGPAERATKELGPRAEGVTYFNPSGTFDVLEVLRGAAARKAVHRRTEWAVRVRRRNTGEVSVHCMVWTTSDHVLKVRTGAQIRQDLAKNPQAVTAADYEQLDNLLLMSGAKRPPGRPAARVAEAERAAVAGAAEAAGAAAADAQAEAVAPR